MNILLFGGNGQVGQEIRVRARELNLNLMAPVAKEVDITDFKNVRAIVKKTNPDFIVHAAAYTAVDLAEAERDVAFNVNVEGSANIARAAQTGHAVMAYISSDYVFAGNGKRALSESDPIGPINVYGASKLEGERQIESILGERSLVVRTSSVHGRYGNNIVHSILKLLEERDQLQFVHDQVMSPTWAGWLAEVILDLLRLDVRGTVHACCKGAVSWFAFAEKVLEIARETKPEWALKKVLPVSAADFPRPAKRPAYSVLATDKLVGILGRPVLDWEVGLRLHMKEIGYGK